eukprot:EG_transcript_10392
MSGNNTRWTKYRCVRKLGHGAYGTVYLAEGRPPESPGAEWRYQGLCAIKSVTVRDLPDKELQLAANEVSILSRLSHPGIVEYFEYLLDNEGYLNVVMEWAPGGDVAAWIKDHRDRGCPIAETWILDCGFQVARALQYLQAQNIIHRDLKPANLFITATGNVKIGDFGISKLLSTANQRARTFLGTPHYIAPELMQGEPYGYAADIWAFGCIMYELAALHPPFEAGNFMALVLKVTSGVYDPVPPHYSPSVTRLIAATLVQDPEARPLSAALIAGFFEPNNLTWMEVKGRVDLRSEEMESRRILDILAEELQREHCHNTAPRAPPVAPEPPRLPQPARGFEALVSASLTRSLSRPAVPPALSALELARLREVRMRRKIQEANERRHRQLRQLRQEDRDAAQARRVQEEEDQELVQREKQRPMEVQKLAYFRMLEQRAKVEHTLGRHMGKLVGEELEEEPRALEEYDPEVVEMVKKQVMFSATIKQLA